MDERQAFLDAIKDNPRDEVVRKVFADWLDEHDEPEEADFYRAWSLEAYEEGARWLEEYANKLNRYEAYAPYGEGEIINRDKTPVLTYEELLQAAHKHLDTGESSFFLNFDMPDYVYEQRKEFWKHFQVVTSRRIPEPNYDYQFFRCSC